MRVGFDAHILTPEHHKHHLEIATYTKQLLRKLIERDKTDTFILFLDARTSPTEVEEFTGLPNVEIKNFPFAQYRAYLPFFYSHMLVSAFLVAARLDVFHSPEGLIPYLYPGKIVATFHWVPLGKRGTNIFLKTWMLGARIGFSALSRKADRIILRREGDRALLCGVHRYPATRAVVAHCEDLGEVDWDAHADEILAVYRDVTQRKSGVLSRLSRRDQGKEEGSKESSARGTKRWGLPRFARKRGA